MKNKAFTLLEIIIAMLILSLVTAGTFGLFVTCHKFITEAKQRLQAVNQASKVIERLRMCVRADSRGAVLEPGTYLPTAVWPSDIPSSPVIDGDAGSWNYTVSGVPGTDYNCKKVNVRITWGET